MQVFWTCVGYFDYTVTGILLSFSTQGPGMLNILQWPEQSLMMKSSTAKMPTALLLRSTEPLSVFLPYALILLWGSSPNPSSLWNFPQTLHHITSLYLHLLYSVWYLIMFFYIRINNFIYKCFAFLNRTLRSWVCGHLGKFWVLSSRKC